MSEIQFRLFRPITLATVLSLQLTAFSLLH